VRSWRACSEWTDEELIDLMQQHPVLIERPIVVTEKGVRLCRPAETVLEMLANLQQSATTREDGALAVDATGNRIV
jgi:arsenate reductase (glutaredoxin)